MISWGSTISEMKWKVHHFIDIHVLLIIIFFKALHCRTKQLPAAQNKMKKSCVYIQYIVLWKYIVSISILLNSKVRKEM